MKNVFFGLGVLVLSCVSGELFAQPETISYTGYLEHDGAPLTTREAGIQMAFFLVEDNGLAVSDNQAQWGDQTEWWEIHPAVQVHQGSFSVALGSQRNFPSGLFSRGVFLYVGMMIQIGEGGWIEIGGQNARQKILASANAINAQEARNFTVRNAIQVEGTTALNGVTQINDNLTVSGDESDSNGTFALKIQNGGKNIRFDGNEINSNDDLHFQNHNRNRTRFYGPVRVERPVTMDQSASVGSDLSVGRDVTVTRNQTVNGAQTVEGNLTVNGDITNLRIRSESNEIRTAEGNTGNEARSDTLLLADDANTMCFLTKVQIRETDVGWEYAQCHVYREGSRSYLRAQANGEATAKCRATCLSW